MLPVILVIARTLVEKDFPEHPPSQVNVSIDDVALS